MKKTIVLLLSIFLLFSCSASDNNDNEPDNDVPSNEDPIVEETYQAFGIMIANNSAARPHSAISLADIVYEIAVDGYSVTRFLAIFASEHPTKVGPVRSARIPFVRMIQEWGLPYAHFGSAATGQGDAKSLIESIKPPIRFDGHQGINNEFYSRDSARKAPHNAYFNAEKALTKIPSLPYESSFIFEEISNVDQDDVAKVSINYSSGNQVRYEFNQENKAYNRFINGNAMMDAYTNSQVAVTNIIVLHAPHASVERVNYVLVNFVGEGKAEYFINGKHEVGTWKKETHHDMTKFFDADGEPLVLLSGNTWIQVVHPRVSIVID